MTENLHTLVREALAPVRLTDTLDDVTARGRRLRRKRRAGTALALTSVLALAAGLLLGLPSDRTQPDPMRLAAWSVRAEPDGAVLVIVRDLTDPAGLTAELEKAGVPALVEFKHIPPGSPIVGCAADGASRSPLMLKVLPMSPRETGPGEKVWKIRRDLMPDGTSLHFVIFAEYHTDGTPSRSVHMSLIEGNPIPCRLVS